MKPETALFKLDDLQRGEKAELEKVIESGIKTFREVGEALATIRAKKLYADEFETFEEYLATKWQMSRAHGFRLMDAASVARNVSPLGDIQKIIPSERVAREIAKVEPRAQKKVARILNRVAKEKRVTASVARAVVEQVRRAPRGGLAAMFSAANSTPEPQSEISLNLKPNMTPIARAQASATINEWWTANARRLNEHPAASPETVMRRILALFQCLAVMLILSGCTPDESRRKALEKAAQVEEARTAIPDFYFYETASNAVVWHLTKCFDGNGHEIPCEEAIREMKREQEVEAAARAVSGREDFARGYKEGFKAAYEKFGDVFSTSDRQLFDNEINHHGYSWCERCLKTWDVVKGHETKYAESLVCFPLCEGCWLSLGTPEARLPFYRKMFDEWPRKSLYDDIEHRWPMIERAVRDGK